jgi:hypothetical protein
MPARWCTWKLLNSSCTPSFTSYLIVLYSTGITRLENLAVSFVCNACANTYVSLCFETRLFPNLRQEPMTVTYFICLSWRVDENSTIKSILYLCKFCFRVSSHCVWSFMLSSLLVRSFILRRLLHDLTISSQNRRKFWHWNDINIEAQMYGTLYPISLDTSSFYK